MARVLASDLIAPSAVRALADANVLREAILVPVAKGWHLIVRSGIKEKVLRMRDESRERLFKTVDGAAAYSRDLGIPRLQVELSDWQKPR